MSNAHPNNSTVNGRDTGRATDPSSELVAGPAGEGNGGNPARQFVGRQQVIYVEKREERSARLEGRKRESYA
jgi:hypothetical protein